MIKLRKGIVFENPQQRIREYYSIEICHGYDDKHSIDNIVSRQDIDAANNLYAMIDRYDNTESERLLSHSKRISSFLSMLQPEDTRPLFDIPDEEWPELRKRIEKLLAEFLSIPGIGLAKATKILHLKRPNIFPVLDSFVVKFLLGINISDTDKTQQLDIGMQALEQTRLIMITQKAEFEKLAKQTHDLPIPLTEVRMFDILCWTAEKWDIRGSHSAPHGTPHASLLKPLKSAKSTNRTSERTKDRGKYVVFEDLERAVGPKVHHVDCFYYKRWVSSPTSTTTWHGPYTSREEAWEICKELSSRSGFQPSKHGCAER